VSLVLAVDPGAGSTKVGLFRDGAPRAQAALVHSEAELAAPRIAQQLGFRLEAVRAFLAGAGVARGGLAAVAGRGGLLRPMESGTYDVDPAMLRDAAEAARGEHASNLGPPMAAALAREHGCPALVVDPVSVDELEAVARVSGLAGVERQSLVHALNIRAVARRHARSLGRALADLSLVVAHLGTGISMAALRGGRMVDVVNPLDEGPMGPDRCGGLPVTAVVRLCFAPGAEERAVRRRLAGGGGLLSHLGTRDLGEALRRAGAGEAAAALAVEAMAYQAAKAVGGLAAALGGRVDAVVLTGGMARAEAFVDRIRRRVEWIAPVAVHPGEDELLALAEGAERVLSGEERARRYGPERVDSEVAPPLGGGT
jgi:butyrate kinase